jgi:hypothetical protein
LQLALLLLLLLGLEVMNFSCYVDDNISCFLGGGGGAVVYALGDGVEDAGGGGGWRGVAGNVDVGMML